MKIAGIIICVALVAFVVWQIYGLIRDIIARHKAKKDKQNQQTVAMLPTEEKIEESDNK